MGYVAVGIMCYFCGVFTSTIRHMNKKVDEMIKQGGEHGKS